MAATKSTATPAAPKTAPAKVTKAAPAPTKVVEEAAPVATPVVAAPAAPAPVEKKVGGAKKTVAKTAAPAESAAPAPATQEAASPAASDAAAPAPAENASEDVFATRFQGLLDKLASLSTDIRDVSTQIRTLQKEHNRFVRDNVKKNSKRAPKAKRNASGFAKPTLLSDEMYAFLGLEKGSLVVRNDVTRLLNKYVVDKSLRAEKDKRQILPDDELKKLLNVTDKDNLTYFNIQKYIKHHFVKPVATA